MQHKNLSITFSSNLNWTAHYKNITVEAYEALGLIKHAFNTNYTNAKSSYIYIALIHFQLMYYSQWYRPQPIKDIIILKCVQRKATKYIYLTIILFIMQI